MGWLALGAILLALGGVGALAVAQERADDDEVIEKQLRAAFAQVGERDVRVSCRRSGERWRCDYVMRGSTGRVFVDQSDHVELSIIR